MNDEQAQAILGAESIDKLGFLDQRIKEFTREIGILTRRRNELREAMDRLEMTPAPQTEERNANA